MAVSLPFNPFRPGEQSRISAPDDAKAIGSDPLILFAHQTFLPTDAEKTVKSLLQGIEFCAFNLNNGRQLSMTGQSLLVGAGQTNQTDSAKKDQPSLDSESQQRALHLSTIGLPLNFSSNACGCLSGAGRLILSLGRCQRIQSNDRF